MDAAKFEEFKKQQLAIDESLYGLGEEESAFFKEQTGIQDDEELKKHLLQAQADAYAIYPYPCIRLFSFTKLKISRLFPYQQFLKLGKEREGAIFLDIGCCFGNDARKAIADGYPIQNVVASDLHQGFWDAGNKLFRTTSETFPVPFIAGDAFDAAHLAIVPPFTLTTPPTTARPDLKSLTSLNPLHGHVSAIHASALFHIFPEAEQLHLARAFAGLLSPEPGSMIFGQHAGLPENGFRASGFSGQTRFCHSPDSWRKMWQQIFAEVEAKVQVEVKLIKLEGDEVAKSVNGPGPDRDYWWIEWVVTRV
ncbi:hypothetical protein BV25DRAFT_1820389 [Artomyces pyxidatus]|uniref:Uncharacterized protein n=1 Tax=Artomyces pyxidatus TaxID=48021 RepID=A0ACB8TDF7_9AGAM|nr:hypothetical protein BV25DRAFT_1820389 [Artomyces pyxidatus]